MLNDNKEVVVNNLLKSSIGKLKYYKDNVPESDNYDSDEPKKICDEIVESLKVFAFLDDIPSELLEIFKNERWIISHQFEYWCYNSSADTNFLSSCNLIKLLENNNKVHEAIISALNK